MLDHKFDMKKFNFLLTFLCQICGKAFVEIFNCFFLSIVCLFVWNGGRGPVLGTGSGRGVPIERLCRRQASALPWFLWLQGEGKGKRGRGGSANEATIRRWYVPAPRVPQKGDGREGEGVP